jgi:hypothetical protein
MSKLPELETRSDSKIIDERLEYELSGIFNKLESIQYAIRDIRDLYKKELLHKGVIKNDDK